MYCGQCGSSISQGNRYCESCGSPVDGTSARRFPGYRIFYPDYAPGSFGKLYTGYIFTVIAYICFSIASDCIEASTNSNVVPLLGLLLIGFGIASTLYWCFLLYRCWAVIQGDGQRVDTTPGRAVGLNFIPFFNCYWAFVAQLGLAHCLNDYCEKRSIDVPRVSTGLAVASSLMATVFYLILPCNFIISIPGANPGLKVLCILVPATAYFLNLAFDFVLYRQFADAAKAIQNDKIDRRVSYRST